MNVVNQQYLREALSYDAATGVLTWLERPLGHFEMAREWKRWNTRYAGMVTGSANSNGYLGIGIGGKVYQLHRLIWLMQTGSWPKEQIDHINHNRTDNRWGNLREVSNAENQRNASARKNNKSGFCGICWHKSANKWCAQIRVDGRNKHLGSFEDINDAIAARQVANIKYNFHKNHGRWQPLGEAIAAILAAEQSSGADNRAQAIKEIDEAILAMREARARLEAEGTA